MNDGGLATTMRAGSFDWWGWFGRRFVLHACRNMSIEFKKLFWHIREVA